MHQAFIIARSLSNVEWSRFTREVKKGILCQHADTIAFVGAVAHDYPVFEVDDRTIFGLVYPGQEFSDARLRVLRTYLKDLLEEFLVKEQLKRDPDVRSQLLIRALFDRNCLQAAKHILEPSISSFKTGALSMELLQRRFDFESLSLEQHIRENKRDKPFNWIELINRLNDFSLSQRLMLLCAMQNESNFVVFESHEFTAQRDLALAEVAEMGAKVNPFVEIYSYLLQLLTTPDFAQHFAKVKSWIARHIQTVSDSDRLNIIGLWINFLTRGDRRGWPGCVRMTFEAYHELAGHAFFYQAGSFSVNSARNALSAAARLGEVEWGTTFLEQACAALPTSEASRLKAFGAAYLAFAQGHYPQAQRLLGQADYSDPFYKLSQSLLLLRISYERMDDDLFLSNHAALCRQLFRKEKVTVEFREGIRSFLKMAIALNECRSRGADAEAIQGLRSKYDSLPLMGLREWVCAKMDALEG